MKKKENVKKLDKKKAKKAKGGVSGNCIDNKKGTIVIR
jgi:hypothetical protein